MTVNIILYLLSSGRLVRRSLRVCVFHMLQQTIFDIVNPNKLTVLHATGKNMKNYELGYSRYQEATVTIYGETFTRNLRTSFWWLSLATMKASIIEPNCTNFCLLQLLHFTSTCDNETTFTWLWQRNPIHTSIAVNDNRCILQHKQQWKSEKIQLHVRRATRKNCTLVEVSYRQEQI